jgi:DNA-binding transcriptional MerR regulator
VRPLKRGGGRRYYRPEDVDLLRRIRNLLYTDGYTIKGVQRLLREGHGKLEAVTGSAEIKAVPGDNQAGERATLENVLTDLIEIRGLLPGAKKRKSKS